MRRTVTAFSIALALAGALVAPAVAQPPTREQVAARMAAQKAALGPLAKLDGEWRGTAWSMGPEGRVDIIQTERVGDMLGGSIKAVEGRGYLAADGSLQFNAFAVIAYNPDTKAYSIRTNAEGFAGDYPLELTADGFKWYMPAGPNAKIVYTAVIKGDSWVESGEYVAEGRPPFKFIELNLKRIGDTDWPAAGFVAPK